MSGAAPKRADAPTTTASTPDVEFLRSIGVDSSVLDAPAPSVASLDRDTEDPLGFVGPQAARLGALFRLSHVSTDQEVERLKAKHFVVLADYRGTTSTTRGDVWVRGIGKRGVVMGRRRDVDATYKGDRARRDWERRVGRRAETRQMGRSGDMALRTDGEYSQVTVEDRDG